MPDQKKPKEEGIDHRGDNPHAVPVEADAPAQAPPPVPKLTPGGPYDPEADDPMTGDVKSKGTGPQKYEGGELIGLAEGVKPPKEGDTIIW